MKRSLTVTAVVFGLVAAGSCSSHSRPTSTPARVQVASPAELPPRLVLAQFDGAVGAIALAGAAPIWREPEAVAALDGSAVFSVRHGDVDRLVRIDERLGDVVSSWPLVGRLSIRAVAPGGRWVALTDSQPEDAPSRDATELVVFDSDAGAVAHHLTLAGNIEPEAFSVDGQLVFALAFHGDHYRVQTIDLATGRRRDTSDRDKTSPAEDMYGHVIRGVLSSDRTLLATLYRNPGNPEEPAFVHVLDLEHAWSYCADLPRPFGTGEPGTDAIELTPSDTVEVGATESDRVAEIHIDEVRTPGTNPVTVEFRDGAVTSSGTEYSSVPGFLYVIAPLPA
jgi:hypothetical protein